MPYVQRNSSGLIIGLFGEPTDLAHEWLEPDASELNAFLQGLLGEGSSETLDKLAVSDRAIVRVLEDLVDTLISKKVIHFTDLPDEAQSKLIERRSMRRSVNALNLFKDDDFGLI